MLTSSVLAPEAPFYAFGNTPAVDLTSHVPQGEDADILLLGCGDVRHILFTAFVNRDFGHRKLDITCCDIEEAIIARNALLLSFLLEDANSTEPNLLWNIYYHLYLDPSSLDAIKQQVTRLLAVSSSLARWKQSKYGSVLRFCDEATLTGVRRFWVRYEEAVTAEAGSEQRRSFDRVIQRSKSFDKTSEGQTSLNYTITRSAAPLASEVVLRKETQAIFDKYWEKGVTGEVSKATNIPNPLFSCAPAGAYVILQGGLPILGYHLATALASLAATSPTKADEDGDKAARMVRGAQRQFREWISAWRMTTGNFTIRFAATDCFALCHTLQNNLETGDVTAHWYRRQLSFSPLILVGEDYGSGGKAPKRFDVIDASNLADHFGALNILISAAPLLKDAPWATLFTEILEKGVGSEKEKFDVLLCGQTKTLSVLLGVSPVEYWTNATVVSAVDQYIFSESLNVSANKTGKTAGIQARISWKGSHQLTSSATSKGTLAVDASALAALIYKIYQYMFRNEDVQWLQKLSLSPNKQAMVDSAYPKYHRGTFVALIKAVVKNTEANRQELCSSLLRMISDNKSQVFASNTLQSLSLEMSKQGLHTAEWLTREIRTDKSTRGFSAWKDMPEAVATTLMVPHTKWRRIADIARRNMIGLTFECSIRAIDDGVPLWHNVYSDVHIAFGTIKAGPQSRSDDSFAIGFDEDEKTWDGTSPMTVSFYVSSAALQANIKKTQVSLTLLQCAQNITTFGKELGMTLAVFETPLEDEKHVFVTKHAPGHVGYRIVGGNLRETQPTGAGTTTAQDTPFNLTMAASGEIVTVTAHRDINSDQGKALLAEKVPIELSQGEHPSAISIVFGKPQKPSLVLAVNFPFPVAKSRTKTRIARKSGYIEIIAPPADPTEEVMYDFVLPSTLARSSVPATLNVTRLNLDSLPILNLEDKSGSRFITTLTSFMFSNRERKLRDETGISGISADNVRLNFKESLFTMFMLASGLQGGQTGLFALTRSDGDGIHVLLFVSAIRLDGPNGSIVLDAAILPFTKELVESKALEDFLLILRTLECCTINVDEAELVLWKKAFPAMVERCRTWQHKAGCEYKKKGAEIPISLEPGAQFLCSCGKGELPDRFVGLPGWEIASRECVRAAISPIFASQFVEEVVDLEQLANKAGLSSATAHSSLDMCRSCGATEAQGGGELRRCARCLAVRYCSAECQKKDWKKHRMECEEAPK